jgi:hypothetical protein
MKRQLFYLWAIPIVVVALLLCGGDCWGTTFFDRVYAEALKDGDKEVIQAYSEFKVAYDGAIPSMAEKDSKKLLVEIDKYLGKSKVWNLNEASRISMIRLKFVAYFLFLKGSVFYLQGDVDNAINIMYLSFARAYQVYSKFFDQGFNSVDFVSRAVFSTFVVDNGRKQFIEYLGTRMFEIPYLAWVPYESYSNDRPKDNLICDLVPVMAEESYGYLEKLVKSEMDNYKLLKPISSALLITYNQDNTKAVALLADIDKKAGFQIPRKVDRDYGFIRMGVYYNEDLVKKLTAKYLPASAEGH